MRCAALAILLDAEQPTKEFCYIPDEFQEPVFGVAYMIAYRAGNRTAFVAFAVAVIVDVSGRGYCFTAYRADCRCGAGGFVDALLMVAGRRLFGSVFIRQNKVFEFGGKVCISFVADCKINIRHSGSIRSGEIECERKGLPFARER